MDFDTLSLLFIVQSKGSSFPIDEDWRLSGYNIKSLSISMNTVYHSLMESSFAQTSKLLKKKKNRKNYEILKCLQNQYSSPPLIRSTLL
jgi:hypothetical protein